MKDDRIYVGETINLLRREREHFSGKGGKTTALFGSNKVIYYEIYQNKELALKRERQIKGWMQAKKLVLASGNISELKNLSSPPRLKEQSDYKQEASFLTHPGFIGTKDASGLNLT